MSAPTPTSERRHAAAMLITLGIAGIAFTLVHRLNADEGQILNGAWNLYNGAEIYQDFFEFIGPASFEWVHLFFQVLGPSYFAALTASWVVLLAGLAAFVGLIRGLTGSAFARWALSVIWLFCVVTPPFINHNAYSSHLAVMFAFVLFRASGRPSAAHSAGAGAIAAVTFFVLQPKGAVLLLLGLVALVIIAKQESERLVQARLVLAYLAGAAIPLVLGGLRWGGGPVTSLVEVASGNVEMNHLSITYLPLGMVLIALASTVWWNRRVGLLDSRTVNGLAVLQIGLWVSTAHLPDPYHLGINAFPLLLLLAPPVGAWFRDRTRVTRGALVEALTALALSASVLIVVRNLRETAITRYWVSWLEQRIGDEDFYAATFLPSFYLELGRPNPYYNSVLYEKSHPAEHFARNVRLLQTHRPEFVIADYATVEKYGHTGNNVVDEYIRSRYERVDRWPHAFGVIEIWKRRERRP